MTTIVVSGTEVVKGGDVLLRYVDHSFIFEASLSLYRSDKTGEWEKSNEMTDFLGSPGNLNFNPNPPWYATPCPACPPEIAPLLLDAAAPSFSPSVECWIRLPSSLSFSGVALLLDETKTSE
jgi:hypothetical protein